MYENGSSGALADPRRVQVVSLRIIHACEIFNNLHTDY
jgi:hypothetical protein